MEPARIVQSAQEADAAMAGGGRSRALAVASLLAASLALSGCGLPPILSLASYALDGISYLTSGKSVTEHALSAVTSEDCALFRVVMGTPVCRMGGEQTPDGEAVVAGNFEPVDDVGIGAPDDASGDHFELASAAQPPPQRQTTRVPGLRVPGVESGTEVYALMQEDGALEVYAHLPTDDRERSNLRMILKIDDYSENPKGRRASRSTASTSPSTISWYRPEASVPASHRGRRRRTPARDCPSLDPNRPLR